MIEEGLQKQSCLSRQRDCRSKGHNHKNLSSVQAPMKMVSVAVITVHNIVKTNVLGVMIIFVLRYSMIGL
jgi:hypothetical protein